jgi:hypothetical protein
MARHRLICAGLEHLASPRASRRSGQVVLRAAVTLGAVGCVFLAVVVVVVVVVGQGVTNWPRTAMTGQQGGFGLRS